MLGFGQYLLTERVAAVSPNAPLANKKLRRFVKQFLPAF